MRIFLIRHGETVDNVAAVYAGSRDSALTTHGMIQATRLGEYLISSGVKATHIFSSDLRRAFKTAEAVRMAQERVYGSSNPMLAQATIQLPLIREQDFGAQEGQPWSAAARASMTKVAVAGPTPESKEALATRAQSFVNDFLVPLHAAAAVPPDYSVLVVSHGIILRYIWRYMAERALAGRGGLVPAAGVNTDPNAVPLQAFRSWANTGYVEVEVFAQTIGSDSSGHFFDCRYVVHAVNGRVHLRGLRKTRGGIGSSRHESSQKTLDSFFQKRPSAG